MTTLNLQQTIGAFLTISVRLSGLMLFAPFFGSQAIPSRIKAGLVCSLALLFLPAMYPSFTHVDLSDWPGTAFKELLIGCALGIATNLVFDAVQMAGQILSTQMGFSLINILDPQTQVDSTVMALFHQTLTMLIFLKLDVHLWMLRALGRSFYVLPPGSVHLTQVFTLTAVRAAGQVFSLGVQMAAPVLSATFLTDIVLGFLGKASPQAPLMLLGTPLKTLLGFAVLFVALRYWPAILERYFLSSMNLSDRLLIQAH